MTPTTRPQATTVADQHPIDDYGLGELPVVAPSKPNGPVLAAVLSAGVGSLALAALTTLSAAIPAVSSLLTLYAPAGPMTGKSTVAVLVWLVTWAVLHAAWRRRDVGF